MSTGSKNTPIKKKSRPQRSSTVITSTQNTELIKTNPEFLQKLRLYWQLGDWISLEALSTQDIKNNEARAECALYIAAACFQLGLLEKGKTYQALALQWGAHKQDVGRVLISGVYNTLGTASTLVENHTSTALPYFVAAAQIALPGIAIAPVIKARTQNQLEHITGPAATIALNALQLLPTDKNQTAKFIPDETIEITKEKFYLFDNKLRIWHRIEQHEFTYTDGAEIEQQIFTAVKSCEDVSVFSRELLQHQIDWASEYHLSADRANLLRPFTSLIQNAHILELGCGCGAITRFLGESGAMVTAVEGSPQRAAIAAERCRDLPNVSVVLDKLQDTPFQQQFDVVTLIGVLEYSRIYVEAEDPIQFVLEKVRSYLKPNGVLIVAIENQLGLKYFAGAPEDHGVGIMAGINDLYGADTPVTFGKQELERRFINAGFTKSDSYLPFPDYKLPNLIVHPAGYRYHDRFDLGNLLTGGVFYDRQGIANPVFSLEASWPLISRNGLTADLANSHLFVVHNSETDWQSNEYLLASHYSPNRSAASSQEVSFWLENNGNVCVKRRRLSTDAAEDQITTEPFVPGILHSQLLHKIVQRPGWTQAEIETWLQQWLDMLEQAVVIGVKIPAGWPNYSKWLPTNYIDAIPRNLIISNDGFSQFIDLEWTLPHNLPLELVLYRGLVITLGTITSVAEPADTGLVQRQQLVDALMHYAGYSLTASDYQLFVPLIEGLSKKAQGLTPSDDSPTQAILIRPFIVRHAAGTPQDKSNRITLYWRRADTVFCEENTVKYQYPMNGKPQRLVLPIAPQQTEYSRLRLDIGEKPGCYLLFELTLCDRSGTTLWEWDFDTQHLSNIGHLTFYQTTASQGGICMLTNSYDPQFEINIPQDVLAAISAGGELIVEFITHS